MTENEVLESALEKVKAQKINFGFMERFNVDENREVMKALEEIQQYRAIGTAEEFKALKEKNTPKKIKYECYCGFKDSICPVCERGIDNEDKYCKRCGQKLDWQWKEKIWQKEI